MFLKLSCNKSLTHGCLILGEIPQELGNLAELELVSLPNNFLSATIPSTFFNLSSLSTGMDFLNNSQTGSLPDDMCRRLPLIKGLYMSNNKLTVQSQTTYGSVKSLLSFHWHIINSWNVYQEALGT